MRSGFGMQAEFRFWSRFSGLGLQVELRLRELRLSLELKSCKRFVGLRSIPRGSNTKRVVKEEQRVPKMEAERLEYSSNL
jgi:hypothetical protein